MIHRKTRPAAAAGLVGSLAISLAAPFVAPHEGLRLEPYRDIVGVPTVCYGDTLVEMRTYTEAECNALLRDRLAEFRNRLAACIDRPEEVPTQTSVALLSWAYNVGTHAACSSTLVRKLNAGDLEGACNELPRWNKAGGKVVRGLVNRRASERALCLSGIAEGVISEKPDLWSRLSTWWRGLWG